MNFQIISIIDNVSKKSFNFKSIAEVNTYRFGTITDQSNYFTNFISNSFRVINENLIYYFNENSKLWENINLKQYETYTYDFFNNSAKEIKTLMRTQEMNDQDDKKIKELINSFDVKLYITKIIERSSSKLTQIDFMSLLDSKNEYLPIQNQKVINLKTLEIRPRTFDDFFTYECPVSYVDKTPNADRFFSELQPKKDNREFLRKVLGYYMTGDTKARKFFIFYGHGSNGKSKILNILQKILVKQYGTLEKSIFMKQKSSGGASPEIMELQGKRLASYSEGETSDSIQINVSLLKQISGEDMISGRHLYGSIIKFYPYAKLCLLTNFVPPLNSETAIKERLIYVFMDSKFTDKPIKKNEIKIDKIFAEKLENEYLSEVFSWIVQGSKEYYKDYKIEMTEEFKNRTEIILQSEDSIETYLTRCMKITDNKKDYMNKTEIFEHYKNYCTQNSQRFQTRSSLWNRIESLGITMSVLNGYDVYRGIKHIDIDNNQNESVKSPLDYDIYEKPTLDNDKTDNESLKSDKNESVKSQEDIELEELEQLEIELVEESKKKSKGKKYILDNSKSMNIDDILNAF